MARRSGNPGKRGWTPMQKVPLNPGQEALQARFPYSYRTPARQKVTTEAWANELYNGVLVWFDDGTGHFTFKRNDRGAVRDWRHFQQIKNEIAGPEREAFELFPPESQLVDAANEYHLWILPEGTYLPLGFRRRAVGEAADEFDRQAQLQGSSMPGARQRDWQPGLTTGNGGKR